MLTSRYPSTLSKRAPRKEPRNGAASRLDVVSRDHAVIGGCDHAGKLRGHDRVTDDFLRVGHTVRGGASTDTQSIAIRPYLIALGTRVL